MPSGHGWIGSECRNGVAANPESLDRNRNLPTGGRSIEGDKDGAWGPLAGHPVPPKMIGKSVR